MKHVHTPERFDVGMIFAISDPSDSVIAVLEAYFRPFAAPVVVDGKQVCIGCGEHFGGLLANVGFGVGIEWRIAHGEGRCNKCGWPYRGMHYIKDEAGEEIASIRNMFLAYHPDEVK